MNQRSPLPPLLGRFNDVQHQHQHLTQLSTRLDAMCDALRAGASLPASAEPTALIAEWSVELSRHFAAEEGIRYFGTLATDRPALLATIADLRADHAAMLEAIEELTLVAADPARRQELMTKTRALMTQLHAHESVENALLKDFFEDPSHGTDSTA